MPGPDPSPPRPGRSIGPWRATDVLLTVGIVVGLIIVGCVALWLFVSAIAG